MAWQLLSPWSYSNLLYIFWNLQFFSIWTRKIRSIATSSVHDIVKWICTPSFTSYNMNRSTSSIARECTFNIFSKYHNDECISCWLEKVIFELIFFIKIWSSLLFTFFFRFRLRRTPDFLRFSLNKAFLLSDSIGLRIGVGFLINSRFSSLSSSSGLTIEKRKNNLG